MLTTAQLAVATFVPGLPQFEGKAFGARLIAYPLLIGSAPGCLVAGRATTADRAPPVDGVCARDGALPRRRRREHRGSLRPLTWWDDLNHFVNWFLLCWGCGLLLRGHVTPRWALVVAISGLGALLAIGWELGEWYSFIRHGTELDTAYEDTLGDETLGTLGGIAAALIVARTARPAPDRS